MTSEETLQFVLESLRQLPDSNHSLAFTREDFDAMLDRIEAAMLPAVDETDIGYLAIGANEAFAKMPAEQRDRVADGFGHDGIIGEVVELAPMLHALWLEVKDRWDSVWYYDISEPLGAWYVRTWGETGTQPTIAEAEDMARDMLIQCMHT